MWAQIRSAINSNLAVPLNTLIGTVIGIPNPTPNTTTVMGYLRKNNDDILASGRAIFRANGTFTVPAGVNGIIVTACGAGGNGHSNINSGGGGGGACIFSRLFTVTPAQVINITVGSGVATILSGLVTLGNGGNGTTTSGGASGGVGGGFGGNPGNPGTPGLCASGGSGGVTVGGGGGSFGGGGGSGGSGGGVTSISLNGGVGSAGSASIGGGGGFGGGGGSGITGGLGGQGIVIIEW